MAARRNTRRAKRTDGALRLAAPAFGTIGLEPRSQPLHDVHVLRLQIRRLAAIRVHVVQLHGWESLLLLAAGDRCAQSSRPRCETQLPAAIANRKRAVAGLHDEGGAPRERLLRTPQRWKKADAVLARSRAERLANDLGHGCEYVDEADDRGRGASVPHDTRPPDDERDAIAAFIQVLLRAAQARGRV